MNNKNGVDYNFCHQILTYVLYERLWLHVNMQIIKYPYP